MILRSTIGSTSRAAVRATTLPTARRAISTAPVVLARDPERLPPGHVRPRRRIPHRPQIPSSSQSYPAEQPNYGHSIPFVPEGGEPISPVYVPSRPVHIPSDPQGVLQDSHAARDLLAHDTLVVVRQIEMLNIFMGFEQANRYAIQTPQGEVVGFLAEEEQTFVSTLSRQFLRTHRPFRAVIMDRTGKPILWIRRPFQFINSRIYVSAAQGEEGRLVGEAQQEWHPWRRRYNVFQSREAETFRQFARIDSGLWAWDFWLKDKDDQLVASINRNFRGLGRELFTDTGQYVIRFDAAGTELNIPPGSGLNVQGQSLILPEGKEGGLTLDQRAMTLATAVSIDFDYFSRHSGAGGMGFPFMIWGGGDGSSDMVRGGQASEAGTIGAAGAAGAAGAMGGSQGGRELSEDEQIYGPQPTQPPAPGQEGMPGMPGQQGWNDEEGWYPDGEEVMEDPWSDQGDDGGLFGGGGGGDGGGWGDWQ